MAFFQSENKITITSSDFEFVNSNNNGNSTSAQSNLLGVGSFGAVKLAKNKRNNQLYAIKMVILYLFFFESASRDKTHPIL